MCTALTLTTKDGYHLFGRNMDLEYNFNQNVVLVPRHFAWTNAVSKQTNYTTFAIMGMASVVADYPLFADAFNEKGLCCAGLNFPGYAQYDESTSDCATNLAPYDLILFILSQFETVSQVRNILPTLHLVNQPFMPTLPIPPLHWIVVDQSGESIVIEKTLEGLKVYDNTVGILTNSPSFDWHLTHLHQFLGLKSTQPNNTTWHEENLTPLGQGLGLYGLPGDFSPPSRFVRAAYFKSHAALKDTLEQGLAEFFHILANVAMVGGSVITPEGKNDLTLYTCCMCQEKGLYYYNTYDNAQINVINMYKEDLDASEIKVFPYTNTQGLHFQN